MHVLVTSLTGTTALFHGSICAAPVLQVRARPSRCSGRSSGSALGLQAPERDRCLAHSRWDSRRRRSPSCVSCSWSGVATDGAQAAGSGIQLPAVAGMLDDFLAGHCGPKAKHLTGQHLEGADECVLGDESLRLGEFEFHWLRCEKKSP